MIDFLIACLISVSMIALTSLITYEILRDIWMLLPKLTVPARLRVPIVVVPIFVAHILNIWAYAVAYFLVENLTGIGKLTGAHVNVGLTHESFLESLYFSAATYTSLGFGDIVPSDNLRMLAAAEVLNGLVLIGWTVSLTYLAMEEFWHLPHGKNRDKQE